GFDGRALDDLIDFHTYASLPLLLLWRAELLPGLFAWVLLLPLLASAYGFSQVDAKTDDGFFLGFPSYWNITAFYLFVLRAPAPVAAAILVIFSVLTFVRTHYLYATRGGPFATTMNVGAALWFVLLGMILFGPREWSRALAMVSLIYPLMYLGFSALVTKRKRRRSYAYILTRLPPCRREVEKHRSRTPDERRYRRDHHDDRCGHGVDGDAPSAEPRNERPGAGVAVGQCDPDLSGQVARCGEMGPSPHAEHHLQHRPC